MYQSLSNIQNHPIEKVEKPKNMIRQGDQGVFTLKRMSKNTRNTSHHPGFFDVCFIQEFRENPCAAMFFGFSTFLQGRG